MGSWSNLHQDSIRPSTRVEVKKALLVAAFRTSLAFLPTWGAAARVCSAGSCTRLARRPHEDWSGVGDHVSPFSGTARLETLIVVDDDGEDRHDIEGGRPRRELALTKTRSGDVRRLEHATPGSTSCSVQACRR
jgi:hypothetical protein